MIRRGFRVLFVVIFVALVLKGCLVKDVPQIQSSTQIYQERQAKIYPIPENITLNGIDYLQSQAPVGIFGGELITSTIGEGPKTFNPFNSKDNTSSTMAGIMYDGLLTTDPISGKPIPKLAKSYEISPNGVDYIIKLRKGIKWSDGKLITADDVVFTWQDIIFAGFGDTSIRDSLAIDGQLPSVEKLDNYTVKFTTPKPYAPFIRMLSTPIAPKHVFYPAIKKGSSYFDSFLSTNTNPEDFVVSGAFKLKEYVPAQRVVFEKNPNYYEINKNGDKLPYLDRLIYLIVGDLNNEVLKFEAKEIDIISLQGSKVARYKSLEPHSDFDLYNLGPTTGTMYLSLNLNDRKNDKGSYYVNPVKQKWFQDLNFRKAVDLAVDRKNMVFNIANGIAAPLFTPESLNSIYLNKELKPYDKNIEKAREYLTQSGFYNDKSGKLFDKKGNRVEFDLYTNAGNTEREAIGVMVKQDLEELGMKVNFKPIEFNSLVNKLVSTFDWDMVIMGLTGSPLEPNGGKNVWLSDGRLHMFNMRTPQEGKINILPWEKELDEMFTKGALATKFEDRKKYYDRYQEIIYNQKPMIYIYSPVIIMAIRDKFKNIYPSSLSGLTYNIEEIYIRE
ncbi:MAG: ABC transporter substrate-binding protein [Cyanobacteria bacterium SIG26]|nr:ABC transporter substrate-binding protein [Cyanobacteria bacterium SIG26]